MKSLTYNLSGGTFASSLYESGPTHINVNFQDVYKSVAYRYIKFLVKFSDSDDIHTIQTTDFRSISGKSVDHVFYPTSQYVAKHNVSLSGLRTDFDTDIYTVNVNVRKSNVLDYAKFKVIDSYLYSNESGVNSLMLTLEMQNPRQVANIVVPFNKVTISETGSELVPVLEFLDVLRTEFYTGVGGEIPIVTELANDYLIKEEMLLIIVIGTEEDTTGQRGETLVVTQNEVDSERDSLLLIPENYDNYK